MTVESNYVIAIATLSDWLKRVAPFFTTNEKQNQNQNQSLHVYAWFFPRFERVTGNY